MIKTLEIFIGADNTTHRVDIDTVKHHLGEWHKGFTIQPAVGYWEGTEEESIVVTISDDYDAIIDTIVVLKTILKQDAIAFHEVSPLRFI